MPNRAEKIITWWTNTKICRIMSRFSNDNLPAYSAQSAFFLFISIFPIIILLSTIVKYTPLTDTMIINSIRSIVPGVVGDTLISWVNEIYSGSSGYISFSIIFILWSASKSFIGIIDSLDNIFKPETRHPRLINRLRATLCTVIFLIAVIVASILLVFGSKLSSKIQELFPAITKSILFVINFRMLISFAIFFIILTFMYSFLTHRTVKIRNAFPGALLTSLGWFLFSYLYSLYIDNFSGSQSIYGSITTIIFLLLWLYFCMYIFLVGAELNYYMILKNAAKKGRAH